MPPSSCRAGAGAGSRPRRPQPVGGRRGRGIGVLECPASAIKVGLGSRTTRNEEGPGDQADHGFDVQTAGRGSRRGRRTIGPMATRDRLIAVACEVALDRRSRTDEERIGPRDHSGATTGLKPALSYSLPNHETREFESPHLHQQGLVTDQALCLARRAATRASVHASLRVQPVETVGQVVQLLREQVPVAVQVIDADLLPRWCCTASMLLGGGLDHLAGAAEQVQAANPERGQLPGPQAGVGVEADQQRVRRRDHRGELLDLGGGQEVHWETDSKLTEAACMYD
jgi:hypothetical protein